MKTTPSARGRMALTRPGSCVRSVASRWRRRAMARRAAVVGVDARVVPRREWRGGAAVRSAAPWRRAPRVTAAKAMRQRRRVDFATVARRAHATLRLRRANSPPNGAIEQQHAAGRSSPPTPAPPSTTSGRRLDVAGRVAGHDLELGVAARLQPRHVQRRAIQPERPVHLGARHLAPRRAHQDLFDVHRALERRARAARHRRRSASATRVDAACAGLNASSIASPGRTVDGADTTATAAACVSTCSSTVRCSRAPAA